MLLLVLELQQQIANFLLASVKSSECQPHKIHSIAA